MLTKLDLMDKGTNALDVSSLSFSVELGYMSIAYPFNCIARSISIQVDWVWRNT